MESSTNHERPRVAVLTNAPAPYRDQLYAALRPLVGSLSVSYILPASADRSWVVDQVDAVQRLPVLFQRRRFGTLSRGLWKLARGADVLLVGGYDQPSYIVAMVFGRLLRKRVVVFFDGVAPSRIGRSGPLERFKSIVLRLPHEHLANGITGRRYFEGLGVPPARIRNQYLVPLAPRSNAETTVSEAVQVLFVGRLLPRKGVGHLIDAIRMLPDMTCTIAGDGPLRPHLERQADGLPVEFVGEVDRARVDELMSSARCLVVPSVDEPWGLVVHEALAHGLPVVAGADMGCVPDLVRDGVNGVVVNDLSSASLADAVRRALQLDRSVVDEHNTAILQEWNLENHVSAFAAAVDPR